MAVIAEWRNSTFFEPLCVNAMHPTLIPQREGWKACVTCLRPHLPREWDIVGCEQFELPTTWLATVDTSGLSGCRDFTVECLGVGPVDVENCYSGIATKYEMHYIGGATNPFNGSSYCTWSSGSKSGGCDIPCDYYSYEPSSNVSVSMMRVLSAFYPGLLNLNWYLRISLSVQGYFPSETIAAFKHVADSSGNLLPGVDLFDSHLFDLRDDNPPGSTCLRDLRILLSPGA